MPRVTVIIPTYNWSSVLPYSIGSVLGQTFTDFELLVIGDGCTDDSEQVVAQIKDPRVRWINLSENTGFQSGPNNEGLRQAQGEFIAYLGHDDLWFPHHLEVLVRALDAGADFVFSIFALIEPNQSAKAWAHWRNGLEHTDWLPPSGVMHRKSITEKIGGWPHPRGSDVAPDVEFWRRIRRAGFQCQGVPRVGVIKFSAARRAGVYKERPCHEQKHWLERIQSEPDLERTALVQMLMTENDELQGARREARMGYRRILSAFVQTTRQHLRRVFAGKPKKEKWKPVRESKGLPPKSWD